MSRHVQFQILHPLLIRHIGRKSNCAMGRAVPPGWTQAFPQLLSQYRHKRFCSPVSFQITILKVLAGHPEGRAPLADLRRAVAISISSGTDWTDRTKRLAARAPGLDIFTQALVLRDDTGWQITDAGRALLASVEKPAPVMTTGDQGP